MFLIGGAALIGLFVALTIINSLGPLFGPLAVIACGVVRLVRRVRQRRGVSVDLAGERYVRLRVLMAL